MLTNTLEKAIETANLEEVDKLIAEGVRFDTGQAVELTTRLQSGKPLDVDIERQERHKSPLIILRELLVTAASDGCVNLCNWCLSMGVNANAGLLDGEGKTPLFYAARYGHLHIVQLLLNHGADPNLRDLLLRSPLNRAAKEGYSDIATYLIEHGANIKNGWNSRNIPSKAIIAAHIIKRDKPRNAIIQCEYDADAIWHGTPLHLAAAFGHIEVMDILLNAGIPIDVLDKEKETPLRWAANKERRSAVAFLISRGANAAIQDNNNLSPRDFIINKGLFTGRQMILWHNQEEAIRYENPDMDSQTFFKYVASYANKLGVTLIIRQQGYLAEWAEFWKKLWLLIRPPKGFSEMPGIRRGMETLDFFEFIRTGSWIYPFLGGGYYFHYDKQYSALRITIPSWSGFFSSGDALISAHLYAYLFLATEDLYQKGVTRQNGSQLIAFLNDTRVQPDGSILINPFEDQSIPTKERLKEIEDLALNELEIPRSVFELMRSGKR
jgi:hypothetical protein